MPPDTPEHAPDRTRADGPDAAGPVTAWLAALGLERYAQAFTLNDVADLETVGLLEADDLKELGVTSIGHRRILLEAIAGLRETSPQPAARAGAQRRQLTVLFADLVGSTALSTRLDPEDLRAVYGAYQTACVEAVERYDGHVAQLLGDGVVVYFGYPTAHENDAERAARAGLELVRRVAEAVGPLGEPLVTRVGIATGVVVVGDVVSTHLGEERPVVGETPNLAARLQAMAPPGGVVLGDRTRALIRGALALEDLGTHELKGFRDPVHVWQVVGEHRPGRIHESGVPLVGRHAELALLRRGWRLAVAGNGQGVLVSGLAGIGKSRLVDALVGEVRTGGATVLRYSCSPHHSSNSLYPVVEQLTQVAGIRPGDGIAVRRARLSAVLGPGTPEARVDALAPLVGLPAPEGISPQLVRSRVLAALLEKLDALCARSPVLAVVENVHWADPSTLDFLREALAWSRRRPLLVVATQREGRPVVVLEGEHTSMLALEPLERSECADLVRSVAAGEITAETLEAILDTADGVPLFVEELARNALESGAGRAERVPATLEDSLVERLDRLGDARALAQIASVCGRDVTRSFVASVADLEPGSLDAGLERLVAAGIMLRREGTGEALYHFRHALVQQAAYGMLLRETRAGLHARVVEVLERTDPEAVERTPELLGRHCAAAGLTLQAIEYWRAAGDRAMRQSAEAEAIASYREALALVPALDDAGEARRLEIQLRTALGVPLLTVHGVAAAEPEREYVRARELVAEQGSGRDLFPILWGLAVVYSGRGEMAQAAEIADELLATAETAGDPELTLEAHHAAWVYDFFLGRLAGAGAHVAAGVRAMEGRRLSEHALLYGGHHPQLCARNFAALLAVLDDRTDEAACLADETLALALASPNLHTRAHCIAWGAIADQLAGRVDVVARRVELLERLADETGHTDFAAERHVFGGWVRAHRGDPGGARREVLTGLELRDAAGTLHLLPYLLGIAGALEVAAGDVERGAALYGRAVEIAARTGERWYEAELDRLLAELTRATGGADDAVARFAHTGVDVAREQGSRLFVRRAEDLLAELGISPPVPPTAA